MKKENPFKLFFTRLSRVKYLPLIVLLIGLMSWNFIIIIFNISPFILPSPLKVASEALIHYKFLLTATAYSLLISLTAWLLSLFFGPFFGLILSLSPFCQKAFYPYAVLFQTIPIVAIAPLVILWLGPGWLAMITLSFFISVFPLITCSYQGLSQTPMNYVEMVQSFGASPWQTWFKVRLPASLPYLIAGAKTSSGLAVVGAVVGEYFTGISEVQGLAYIIRSSQLQVNYALLFAASLMTALLGISFCSLVHKLGQRLLERKHYARF